MLYFVVTLLIFSSMEVVSKPLMGSIDPFTLTFARFVIGFSVLAAYLFAMRRGGELKALNRKTVIMLALLGLLNTFFSMSMLQLAVKHASPATAATIFCSNPLFVYLFTLLADRTAFSVKRLSGLLLGMGGVVCVMSEKGLTVDAGAAFALLGSVTFALYTFLNKRMVHAVPALTVNVVSFFFGLIGSAIFLLFSGKALFADTALLGDLQKLSAFLYLGVFVSGIGYVTFMKTIQRYTPVSASVIFLMKPALATLLAILFLAERPGTAFFAGLLLTAAGSFLALGRPQPKPEAGTR